MRRSEQWAGFGAAPAGDVDADGLADVLVGAFRFSLPSEHKIDAGKAYLVRMGELDGPGTYSLADAHASWLGDRADHVLMVTWSRAARLSLLVRRARGGARPPRGLDTQYRACAR